MRLTTKGRYAVTAMLDLALHAQEGPVSLADISERQGISLSYLEELFAKLRRGSLVTSVRGPGGGYQLSRDMASIDVAQVIDAVNESVDATRCQGPGRLPRRRYLPDPPPVVRPERPDPRISSAASAWPTWYAQQDECRMSPSARISVASKARMPSPA